MKTYALLHSCSLTTSCTLALLQTRLRVQGRKGARIMTPLAQPYTLALLDGEP